MMSPLHWRTRLHDCRGHTLHEMIPTSVWQRVGRPVRHGATNFDQIDVFTQRGYIMKLISNERIMLIRLPPKGTIYGLAFPLAIDL